MVDFLYTFPSFLLCSKGNARVAAQPNPLTYANPPANLPGGVAYRPPGTFEDDDEEDEEFVEQVPQANPANPPAANLPGGVAYRPPGTME